MTEAATHSDELSAEQLACRAQDGCSVSFDRLVERYARRVCGFLRRRGLGEHDAEDVTQEAFIKAWRNIRRFRPPRRFEPWLFTIAYRQAISHFRGRRSDSPLPSGEIVLNAPGPSDVAAGREQSTRLWALAGQLLGDDPFAALWLHYGEGMSVKETAGVLGKTGVHVKVMLHRARRRLLASRRVGAMLDDGPPRARLSHERT